MKDKDRIMTTLITAENKFFTKIDAYPLSFTTQEALSENAIYTLEIISLDPQVDLEALLGQKVEILVNPPEGEARPFSAYIISGKDNGQLGEYYVYEFTLSTWFWFLDKNRNCRIFQQENVIDIIEKVFSSYAFADYKIDIEHDYPQKEYCVQFSESDFNFVNRLLEHEGIWYYFEQEADRHILVITDKQNFDDLENGYDQLDFMPDSEEQRMIRESIQSIQRTQKIRPTEVVLRDFDYLNPSFNLQTKVEDRNVDIQGVPLEWYDYALGYDDTDIGEHFARLRIEQMASENQVLTGKSNAVKLMSGKAFSLNLHPDSERNRRFKLLECNYTFIQDGPDSATSRGESASCEFVALVDSVAFRPEIKTEKPKVSGVQSATVVGPENSEVHTEEHARIRVHFHWDRYKTTEEDSSCWIRVSQAWAGKGWGTLAMPRVGQEVILNYVDGDIDRPLVVGVVYNGDNPPPYQLPEHTNYSGMVSRSQDFGLSRNANHLTFDDNRDNERIMMHAERDMQAIVERNAVEAVGNDSYQTVARTAINQAPTSMQYGVDSIRNTVSDFQINQTRAATTTSSVDLVGTALTSVLGNSVDLSILGVQFSGSYTRFLGNYNQFVGISSEFIAKSVSFIGSNVEARGSNVEAIGSNVVAMGSTIEAIGSRISVLGSDIAVKGVGADIINLRVLAVGLSLAL